MRVGHFTSHAGRSEFQRRYAEAMALSPEPDVLTDVNTPFGTVRTFRFGPPSDAPFVVVPGMGAPASLWTATIAGLAAHRTVYALDTLGGAGASMQRVPIRTTADQVHWLRAFLDAGDLPSVHLVGSSLGAWHALLLAARAPAGVASLAMVEPTHTLTRMPPSVVFASWGATASGPEWLRRRFLTLTGGQPGADDPISRVVATGMRTFSPALPAPSYPSDDDLRAVRVPTLVLLGGRSTVHDASRARARAERLLPDVRVEVWPDATHALPFTHTGAVVEQLVAHADAVDAARTSDLSAG
ncbi:alpha/beta fold hydrolase [Pseudonocardia endophytica]|uniref:Pimeloyl-ACP methyl ester carboxylesterase n=1 Tax=Pseudonocardia endophytica TaxID=401976 RepID=A0A4R1I246_PSEEN|nr:alpha/beta hydrolase [Pseudonocardia endophytica]TCK27340.1 pimeloyl-ACP methyl ester carboxylesterase [Pseudonocardia endophytica]